MMRRLTFLLLILASLVGINSCQKELTDPNAPIITPGGTGDFRATINGSLWIATTSGAARQNGYISVAGQGGGKTIAITLTDSGVHHYTLTQNTLGAAAYSDSSSGSNVAFTSNATTSTGGSVDITSIDTVNKKISGTFRFTAYRAIDSLQRTITSGSFTNITYATTTPPAVSTDTFTVKIDGVTFNPFTIQGLHITILNQLSILGTDQAGLKSVSVYLPDTVTPGTYPITGLGGSYFGQYNKNATTFLASDTGTVTILEHNTSTRRIRGTFSFHATELLLPTDQSQLTEGYFSVVHQ